MSFLNLNSPVTHCFLFFNYCHQVIILEHRGFENFINGWRYSCVPLCLFVCLLLFSHSPSVVRFIMVLIRDKCESTLLKLESALLIGVAV